MQPDQPRGFGDLLPSYRELAGLSREQLAEGSGLSAKGIGALERGERRRPYPHTVDLLAKALGLETQDRRALMVAAKGGVAQFARTPQAAEPSPGPASLSLDRFAAKQNLPAQLTSFVGREHELAEIESRLTDVAGVPSGPRLLTLTGAGGCGKTRLALQVGFDLSPTYPDGIWLVELAPIGDPALVAPTVASVLGIETPANRPVVSHLVEALRSRRVLLLLDNCEHVLDASAHLADTILRGCPNVHILATSRETLGIVGEVSWRVPSLALPPADTLPPISDLLQIEAVRLFVERARAVQPGFVVTAQNAAAVAQVCRRLDGIPLAIELAAARLRGLTVEQIAARLDDQFRLLTGGSRTALPRQQTLRAAVDWSHDLLSEPERVVFRRLSIFVGGWTLEAAEDVCGEIPKADPRHPILREAVLDLLLQLVDKSLVIADQQGQSARYRFLEMIRQYAGEKLTEADEVAACRDRQSDWCIGLAEAAQGDLRGLGGPHLAEWLEHLDREHDNLRAALRWTIDRGDANRGVRLGGALWRFWVQRGHVGEGWRRLQELLTEGQSATATSAWAQVLLGAGSLARFRGDLAAARSYGQEGIGRLRELDDRPGLAEALVDVGTAIRMQGDYAEARAYFEEGLAIWRERGEQTGVIHALSQLGLLAEQQEDEKRASALGQELLDLSRALQNQHGILFAAAALGSVGLRGGDLVAARAWFREALTAGCAIGYRWGVSMTILLIAYVAAAGKQAERALRLAGAVAAMHETMGVSLAHFRQTELDRRLAPSRQILGEAAASATWSEGHKLTLEQVVEYALEEDEG
jgi:predicted ATPase/transcriptional regulator with XRE-family HTH domain